MTETGYVGFGNDTLARQPEAIEGMMIVCPTCHGTHPLEFGEGNGVLSKSLGFYKCGDETYLAAVGGRLIGGVTPDCPGTVDLDG